VAIFLTCMSVRVCRPKLFKNHCLSLVSGVPHFFFRTTPLVARTVYFILFHFMFDMRTSLVCCKRALTHDVDGITQMNTTELTQNTRAVVRVPLLLEIPTDYLIQI